MSEARVTLKAGKFTTVDGYTCTECQVWGPYREVHTFLFCELHKMGWSREKIIANVLFTADALRSQQ